MTALMVGFSNSNALPPPGSFVSRSRSLGDFEFGGDGLGNALEFARLVEGVDEIAEGMKSDTPLK
jgi:hypothetical protein